MMSTILEGVFDLEQKKMQVGFRPAVQDDISSLQKLLVRYYAHGRSKELTDPPGLSVLIHNQAGETSVSGGMIWVAHDILNDEIVASFFLDFPNPDYAALQFFLIQPELVKTALPYRIAKFATSKAQEFGARDICIWNDQRFTDIISCFSELGYLPTGAKRAFDQEGSHYEEECYARSLWYQPEQSR